MYNEDLSGIFKIKLRHFNTINRIKKMEWQFLFGSSQFSFFKIIYVFSPAST